MLFLKYSVEFRVTSIFKKIYLITPGLSCGMYSLVCWPGIKPMLPAAAAAAAKLLQSCLTLCDAIDGSPLGFPVPGILQARTVSGLPLPSPMHESENESAVAQSCPTLSDPTDCSLPGFSVHRIFWKELQEALFQEAGKGSSQDVGKESLLRGRIGGHLFCVANLYLEGTG